MFHIKNLMAFWGGDEDNYICFCSPVSLGPEQKGSSREESADNVCRTRGNTLILTSTRNKVDKFESIKSQIIHSFILFIHSTHPILSVLYTGAVLGERDIVVNNLHRVLNYGAFFAWSVCVCVCVCMIINKCQVVIRAIMIIKLGLPWWRSG